MNRPLIDIIIDFGKTYLKFYFFSKKSGKILKKILFKNRFKKNNKYLEIDLNYINRLLNKIIKYGTSKYNLRSIFPITHGSVLFSLNKKLDITTCISDENKYEKKFDNNFKQLVKNSKSFITPLLPNGYNLAKNYYYIKKEIKPDNIYKVLFYPQYISFYLSGKLSTELTYIGNHSFLWDFQKKNFSNIADKIKILNHFSKIKKPFQINGNLKREFYKKNQYKSFVHVGGHDSSCCLYLHEKINKKKFILISTGTWFISYSPNTKINNNYFKKNIFYSLSVSNKKVATSRYPGGTEYEILNKKKIKIKNLDIRILKNILRNKDYILPSFHEGGSYINRKGKIVVNNKKNIMSKKYMYHLIMLYISLMSLKSIELFGKISRQIFIDGKFGENILYRTFMSNLVYNQRVFLTSDIEGVAKGGFYMINKKLKVKNFNYKEIKKNFLIKKTLKKYKKFWEKKINSFN